MVRSTSAPLCFANSAFRQRLGRIKHLITEPRESSLFAACRGEFEAKLDGVLRAWSVIRLTHRR